VADAWHDGIEIVSGVVALLALALTLYDPQHFSAADHWSGLGVGAHRLGYGISRCQRHKQ
jgi:hypothetical protein